MSNTNYPVAEQFLKHANTTAEIYQQKYQQSINDPDTFWREQAKSIDWIEPFNQVKNCSFDPENFKIEWFVDGKLNVAANCLDRYVLTQPEKTAIIWEGDDPRESRMISYRELHEEVCRFANVLKQQGIKKGDRVIIYLPMIPEAAVSMLACARIGAIHCVVFGGFSPDALANRIEDSGASLVITADASVRGGKTIPLKENIDLALSQVGETEANVVVVKRVGAEVTMVEGRDLWYHQAMETMDANCAAEVMDAEDPLFILYTSGSTGKPKGVLHTTGGYLVHINNSFKDIFDLKEDDIYWCTADVGWVTGHSYLLYGPLSNGTTTVMFEGVPQYPTWGRAGEVIDKYKVSILYTAPTLIRSLMREGDHYVKQSDRRSLRLIGTVGEPINPEAWVWYHDVVGDGRCPVIDTWWQTETGGVMIATIAGSQANQKPGAATQPYYGVQPALVDSEGQIVEGDAEGNLVILDAWPGMMRSVYGDHQRFIETYFSAYKKMYFTGDGSRRDEDNDYWITGRVDDVLNVSGHRLGTAEIESALVSHHTVAEAAVVGMPDDTKGQGVCAFVTLQADVDVSDELRQELMLWVRKEIGAIAKPDAIHWAIALPKTRSGKIMRRILRKIAANELDSLGDTSTLADPSVVDVLIDEVYPNASA